MSDTHALTEIPAGAWTKSSYSGTGSGSDCVEIAPIPAGRAVRDSKNPAPNLRFTNGSWTAFIQSVAATAPNSL